MASIIRPAGAAITASPSNRPRCRVRVAAALISFALVAAASPAAAQDDHGNVCIESTDLPLNRSVSGVLETSDDLDVFTLTLDDPAEVIVFIEGDDLLIQTTSQRDGQRFPLDWDLGNVHTYRIVHTAGSATYCISVRNNFGITSAGRSYEIEAVPVLPLAIPDRVVDKNITVGATHLYKVTLARATYLDAWTVSNLNMQGRLLDVDGQQISGSVGIGSRNLGDRRIEMMLPAGTYYIEVTGTRGQYTLVTRQGRPTNLAFGARISGEVRAREDRAYYQLNVDTPTMATVRVEAPEVFSRLLDADGRAVTYRSPMKRLLAPGAYFIEVEGFKPGRYTVVVEAEPIQDMAFDTEVEGEFQSSSDAHGYRLTAEIPIAVFFRAAGEYSLTFVTSRLLDADGREISPDENDRIGFNFYRVLGPGTYFVEVRGARSGTYVLSTSTEPVPHLPFGIRVDGEIDPAGTYNRLILDTMMNVRIWTEGSTDTAGKLYDEDGSLIAWVNGGGEDKNFLIDRVLGPGTYYVGVVEGSQGAAGSFALRTEAEQIPGLTLGARISGEIQPRGDADWYRLRVDSTRFVTVWTEGGTNTYGILTDEDGNFLDSDSNDGQGENFRIERLLRSGTYYVVVRGQADEAIGEYILEIGGEQALDTAFGDRVDGEIGSAGERDRYVLTLETWQVVSFWTEGGTDTVVRIYDADGRVIAFDDDTGDGRNFRIERALAPGAYYVEVGANQDTIGQYVLASGITEPVPDLWFGERKLGELAARGARDHYRLTVDSPAVVTVWTEHDPLWTAGPTDNEGILFDADGNQIEYVQDFGDGENGNFRIERVLAPGAYYVEVRGRADIETGDYIVAAESEPVPDLGLDAAVEGEFEFAGDENWFRLNVTAPTLVDVRSVEVHDTNPVIRLYDEGSNYLWVDPSATSRIDDVYTIERSLGPGTYYVEVKSGFIPGRTGEYLLIAYPDPEPVTDLALGAQVADEFSGEFDVDWFRLTVDTLSLVTVRTEGGADTVGRLHRGDGGVIAFDDDRGEANNFRIERVLGPGDYYIEVSADSNNSVGEYVVVAESGPIPATDLAFGNRVSGEISPADDEDWFRLTVTAPAHVSVRTEGDADTAGRLMDADGNEIAADDDSGEGFGFLIEHLLKPGSYYVAVQGNGRRSGDYVIEAETDPTLDLALGVPAFGRIASGDDVAWYRLELSEAAAVAVYTTGGLDTVGSLRDEGGARIGLDDDGGQDLNFHIEGDRPAGVYYVQVESYGSESGHYTLHARRYVDLLLPDAGGETLRLWATAFGGWTLDPATDAPFLSGDRVTASNGIPYALTLGPDEIWTAVSCGVDSVRTIRTVARTNVIRVAVDALENVYVADRFNHRIRRIGLDGRIETIAGTGAPGFDGDGGEARSAEFDEPVDVAVDAAGNVYVADRFNHRIRRIGPDGRIETIAGTGAPGFDGDGGEARSAELNEPVGVAVDASGNVYVAELGNHRIRRIGLDGRIETIAGTGARGSDGDGGEARSAELNEPIGVVVDASGNVYVADLGNDRIRRIGPDGIIETFAGTGAPGFDGDGGEAKSAELNGPVGVAVDASGNVYVADRGNHRLRRIGTAGIIETFAGTGVEGFGGDGGPATAAELNSPMGVAVDASGNVYVADHENARVRLVEPPADDHGDSLACATPLALGVPAAGRIEVGNDTDWFRLELSDPASVAIYTTGDLDTVGSLRDESDLQLAWDDDLGGQFNFRILAGERPAGVYYVRVDSYDTATGDYTLHARRYVDVPLREPGGETVRLWAVASGGWTLDPGTDAPFVSGGQVAAVNSDTFVLTLGSDGVWRASAAAGACEAGLAETIRTLAGTGTFGYSGDGELATSAQLDSPVGVAVDAAGNVYVADEQNHRIRRIAANGTITTLAGEGVEGDLGDDGPADRAQLNRPASVAVDAAGNVYVADTFNNRIRRIAANGTITAFAGTGLEGDSGDGGRAAQARFNRPAGVAVDAAGYIYIADTFNHRIRRVDPGGTISTLAGTGEPAYGGDGGRARDAQLSQPQGVAVDAAGNVYVADSGNSRIRRIAPDGTITTIAGTGDWGGGGDGGQALDAQLSGPRDVAVDEAGNVYVAAAYDHRIRRISPDGIIETLAGTGIAGDGGDGVPARNAALNEPSGVAVDAAGRVYIADYYNHRIRVVDPADDHGDEAACATPLALGASAPGRIEVADDQDWFRLELSEAASVGVYTTGDLDTLGTLTDESASLVASDDDGGADNNFHMEGDRTAGVYYIRVESYGSGTGRYALQARRYSDVRLGATPETVRLWGTASGGWTLDRRTDAPFASGGQVVASNGDRYVLSLGIDGLWTAAQFTPATGSCEADLTATIRTLAISGDPASGADVDPATVAHLDFPTGVAVGAAGYVYVADNNNHRVRRIGPDGTIETIAGTGQPGGGGDEGRATEAQLRNPRDVAVDAAGYVYIADSDNHRIRRVAPDGTIRTVAGTGVAGLGGDGDPATEAQLDFPTGVAVDAAGNLYVADAFNFRVRRISPDGIIRTIANFVNDNAFGSYVGLAVDASGNVYVAEAAFNRILRFGPDGTMTRLAGRGGAGFGGDGGQATEAQLDFPTGVAVDAAGNVYVADRNNHRIRRIAADGTIDTVAGTGVEGFGGDGSPATSALLDSPSGLAVDSAGRIFIADSDNHRVRVVEPPADVHGDAAACATALRLGVPAPGRIEPGDDEDWFRLELTEPLSVAIYTTGDLDTVGSLQDESGTLVATGNDGGDDTNFHLEGDRPAGVYHVRVQSFGSATGNYTLHARRYVDVALSETGSETVRLWGTANGGWTLDPGTDVPFASGNEVEASGGARYTLTQGSDGVWTASPVAESCEASLAGTIRTLGGTAGLRGYIGDGGFAVDAQLNSPFDVAVDAAGYVFVADRVNNRIRWIGPDGIIRTFAGTGAAGFIGDDGPARESQLNGPIGVAVDAAGQVYVADRHNHRIRRIDVNGTIKTIAGTGRAGFIGDGGSATAAQLNHPTGVAVDAAGNVYVADSENHRIRRISSAGRIETIAGTGFRGYDGDGDAATEARLNFPFDVAVDAGGSVYVADALNHRVRRVGPDGRIATYAGTGADEYWGDRGSETAAPLDEPAGLAVTAAGYLFVADFGNHRIRRISPDGMNVTFAGTGVNGLGGDDGFAIDAQLLFPSGVTVDAMGRVYIADSGSHRVRVVDLADGCR